MPILHFLSVTRKKTEAKERVQKRSCVPLVASVTFRDAERCLRGRRLMAGRIQGCDLDVVPALMGRLGSPCGTPDTSAIVISTKRSAWRDL